MASDGSVTDKHAPALDSLTPVLCEALRALAARGRAEDANRLAGRAYVALRRDYPSHAQRINALMHVLTRAPTPTEEDTMHSSDRQLDVRSEAPARRHELIFDSYHRLDSGEDFVLVNDHDPKPLYYQLQAEHPDQFTWEYLDAGPEVWRVRIGRAPSSLSEPLPEIASDPA